METVIGYKAFNPDWTCTPILSPLRKEIIKQYSCPGMFEEDVVPKVYEIGMHFSKQIIDCFRLPYKLDPQNKYAEIIACGNLDEAKDSSICCTNKLLIVREISFLEVLTLATKCFKDNPERFDNDPSRFNDWYYLATHNYHDWWNNLSSDKKEQKLIIVKKADALDWFKAKIGIE